jgi:alanyl-tRNA synthetase
MPVRKLSGSDVRSMFLRYFEQHGHKIVRSSSLVPANDPTLLFTNAGMNQFKDVFLGIEKREYARATSSQKCVRAGGKHNDLENVGFTNRHHTFFEMLGNFSFGDYFKKDAIAFAWELVTSPEWFGIEKGKLYVTFFEGSGSGPGSPDLVPRDSEAERLWTEIFKREGLPLERIRSFGAKENFWQMGDTGPCGPCSEIHYDMGVAASDAGHTDCEFGCECGRYVELWNLVFMQYERDSSSSLNNLPKPSIDTGAGLERVTAVMQGVISNYDTDLFVPLIRSAAVFCNLPGANYSNFEVTDPRVRASLNVIADHARATTFLISDGVIPSNEWRGYVLRKIMRRAMRHARMLGGDYYVLSNMATAVATLLAGGPYEKHRETFPYPELGETLPSVLRVIRAEEIRFEHTMSVGLTKLEDDFDWAIHNAREEAGVMPDDEFNFANLSGYLPLEASHSSAQQRMIGLLRRKGVVVTYPGQKAFKLYDTFGLPLDFMVDAARDQGIEFDQAGFDAAMQEQRRRARASWKGTEKQIADRYIQMLSEGRSPYEHVPDAQDAAREPVSLSFVGYKILRHRSRVVYIGHDTSARGTISGRAIYSLVPQAFFPGDFHLVLEETPFYATAGGQVGDRGVLLSENGSREIADVLGCEAPIRGVNVLTIRPRPGIFGPDSIKAGDQVIGVVDAAYREDTMRNHTGTHLLHAALREVLGKHVKQAGSLVDPAHLRFDFSHVASLGDEELQDIEDLANREVLRNDRVEVIEDVPIDVAVNEYHAMALFGEKYGDRVRVIRIGDFSTELCGGTHTSATGEIGLIKILKEGSVSSGVRRLEAVTGEGSLRHFRKDHQLENVVSTLVRGGDDQSPADALKQELERREEELKKLRRELDQARMKSASTSVQSAAENVREIKGVKVLATRADNLERAQLRVLIDNLRNKLGSGVVVLGSVSDGKVALIVGVTKDLTSRVQAGKVIAEVAKKVGGSGGGRPDMAEAGGKDPAALDSALAESYNVVERLLQ